MREQESNLRLLKTRQVCYHCTTPRYLKLESLLHIFYDGFFM